MQPGDLNASEALESPALATPLSTAIPVFACPSDQRPAVADRGNGDPLLDSRRNPHPQAVALQSYVAHAGRGGRYGFSNSTTRWHMLELASYLEGPFGANIACTFDMILDGTATTIALGERAWEYPAGPGRALPSRAARMYMALANDVNQLGADDALGHTRWGINYPYAGLDPGGHRTAELKAKSGYSSRHVGGANFAMCDGSVRFLSEHIEHKTNTTNVDSVLESLAHMRDGTQVGDF